MYTSNKYSIYGILLCTLIICFLIDWRRPTDTVNLIVVTSQPLHWNWFLCGHVQNDDGTSLVAVGNSYDNDTQVLLLRNAVSQLNKTAWSRFISYQTHWTLLSLGDMFLFYFCHVSMVQVFKTHALNTFICLTTTTTIRTTTATATTSTAGKIGSFSVAIFFIAAPCIVTTAVAADTSTTTNTIIIKQNQRPSNEGECMFEHRRCKDAKSAKDVCSVCIGVHNPTAGFWEGAVQLC